jgi:hypothetical protein
LIIPEHTRDLVVAAHESWVGQGIEISASEMTLCHKWRRRQYFFKCVLFSDEYNKKET